MTFKTSVTKEANIYQRYKQFSLQQNVLHMNCQKKNFQSILITYPF